MKNFIKNHIIVIIAFFVTSLILTFPLILNINNKLAGDGGDNYQYVAYQQIVAKKIRQFVYPFSFDKTLRYPVGFDFSRGQDTFLPVLTGGLLNLVMNYILSYNITLLIFFAINGICSYLLFNYVSKSKLIGIIGGVMYGFSFYTLARGAGQIGHATTAGFPLFLYSILKLKNNHKLSDFLLVVFSVLFIVFAFLQYLLIFTILILVNIPIILVLFKQELKEYISILCLHLNKTLVSLAIFCIIFFAFLHPFIFAITKGAFVNNDRKSMILNLKTYNKDYIAPNPYSRTLAKTLLNSNTPMNLENLAFMGWVEIALVTAFLFFYPKSKIKYFISANFFIFFLLSLGTVKNYDLNIPLPQAFLYKFFLFYYIPEVTRYIIVYSLFAILGITLLLTLIKRKTIVLILLLLLTLTERLTGNYYLASSFKEKKYISIVKKTSGKAVLDIPLSIDFHNTVYDIFPALYNKNIVSGYFIWSADTIETRLFVNQEELKRLICDLPQYEFTEAQLHTNLYNLNDLSEFIIQQEKLNRSLIEKLKAQQINTIVVHKNDPEDHAKFYFPECANVRIKTSILLPQLFMPDPTEKVKTISLFFPAIPSIGDTILFEDDGIFYLDGIHAYPNDWLPLHIFLDGQEILMEQKWIDRGAKNATLDPFLKIEVTRGSKISFSFDKKQNKDYSFIKLWYRYETKTINNTNQYLPDYPITKIYEDDDAAVFSIK